MKAKLRKDYREMSTEGLRKKQTELGLALAQILLNRYTKQSRNTRQTRSLRRELAVIATWLRAQELSHVNN